MALFDLRKRRQPRKDAAAPEPAGEAHVAAPAPVEPAAPAAPSAIADPAAQALALGAAPEAALPELWQPALQDQALGLVGRSQDALVLGLAPWGTAHWPQKLMGRARSVVVVDPDKTKLAAVRPYAHRTLEAELSGLEWLAKLGGQRFGTVILGDALTHLADPVAFLRRVRETLTEGGSLIAVVPNAAWGEERLALLAGEVPRDYQAGAPMHRYNHDRLREALALGGFAIAEAAPFRTELFEAGSQLVPELFPEAIVQALGPELDATVSHLVVRATPVSAEAMLRTLFGEQETLRKAVRNELARARRTHDALTYQLKASDATRESQAAELEALQKKVVGLEELTARAEQNIKRLGKEVDDAQREVRGIHASFAYRVACWFQGKPKPEPKPTSTELTEWKVEEPKSRYL